MDVSISRYSGFTALLVALSTTLLQGCATAAPSLDHEITAEAQGTRVVWAKPLADGPIRVLFIAPRFTLGDVVELDARLDMRYETVGLWDAANPGYDPTALAHPPEGASREEVLGRLQEALRGEWDVIFLGNLDTAALTEPVISAILGKVAGGTGLVTAHLRDGAESPLGTVLDALPPEDGVLPVWNGVGECALPGTGGLEGVARILRHEKGRIVALEYPGDPPAHHCIVQAPADPIDIDAAFEDNAYSLAIRALCAAAGRVNPVRIQSIRDAAPSGPDDLEIPPDFYPEFVQAMRDSVVAQPSRPFQLNLDSPADRDYIMQAQLRKVDSDTRITYADKTSIPRGATSHPFEIPAGPGAYMLDIWLTTRSGIADWHTTELNIPGWPEFHNLKVEKNWLLPNDSLEVSLEVRPVVAMDRQGTIYARAQDGYGRFVSDAMQAVSKEGGTVSLRLHFSDLLSPLVKLEIFAADGPPRTFSEWELHCAYRQVRYLSVRRQPGPANLELVASVDEPREYASGHLLNALSGAGVTSVHAPAGEATIVAAARAHIPLVPELTRVAVEQARDGLYRDPCLNDPDYLSTMEVQLRESALRHWAGTETRYSLGKRNYLCASEENLCQCGSCLGKFQQALQASYEKIDALNAAWQSAFGDWDFIEVPTGIGPGQEGPPAPWVDFRVFMDNQFSAFHGWARSQAAATDTAGQVGACFAGNTSPYYGYYWPDLFHALDFVAADYTPLFLEKARSYAKPGSWSGVVLPDAASPAEDPFLSWLPWRLAFNGIQTLWVDNLWGDANNTPPSAWIRPDGAASPALQTLAATVATIRDTVGPLFYAADRPPAKVGIYDSHYTRHLCEVNRDYSLSTDQAQQAAAELLGFASYAFRFMDKAALASVEVKETPAIVLPLCRALDPSERAALRVYVEKGGALIADVVPGVFDAHGVRAADSGLEDVFGIQAQEPPRITQAALTTTAANDGAARDAGWALVDGAITLRGGVALADAAGTPAWVVNRFGNGHTLLLNHPFREIQRQEERVAVPAESEAIGVFLGDLPEMSAAPKAEGETFLGQLHVLTFGEAQVFTVQADLDAPRQEVRLPLQGGDAVYDALTGEPIRRPHRHKFRVAPGAALIVTRLPYPLEELVVQVPELAYAGQHLPVQVLAQPEGETKPGKHIFILDLIPQNKPPVPWYHRILIADLGAADFYVPLARNEMPGWYTLRVRDALTGTVVTKTVKIAVPVEEAKAS